MSHRFISHDENGDLRLRTPYNNDFIDALKDLVDKDSRRWDRDAKHWWVK